jgi:oligoendopeptidase F
MFGLLFGLGLYSVFQRSPEGFQDRYEELLSLTGCADADTLAGNFGIDLRDTAFWKGSLDKIRADIDLFDSLV